MSFASSHHTKTYLALGDSYTIGESVPASDRYPVQLVKLLNKKGVFFDEPVIIATTGWATGDLLQAIGDQPPANHYDLVTLLIGVNDQYQGRGIADYRKQFETLLQQATGFAGGRSSNVIILSIPDYSVTPFAKNSDRASIAAEIDSFNEANKSITRKYGAGYIDITAESRKAAHDSTLLAGDGLHYSGKAYCVWALALVEWITGRL